tara:strand:+ start:6252 stop:6701 length:450 start_codon:yes stop_codon:yes gene_type:complete
VTRIDFYLLSSSDAVATVCRLCEKAVGAGKRIYVLATDGALAEQLDGALWSFRQNSFIAHERFHGEAITEPQPPILIGDLEAPPSHHDILVNLGAQIPDWFSSFERVLEVVDSDENRRSKSRERFRFYRERGYPLKTYAQTEAGGWQQK